MLLPKLKTQGLAHSIINNNTGMLLGPKLRPGGIKFKLPRITKPRLRLKLGNSINMTGKL